MSHSKDCILIDLMEQWPCLFKEAYLLDHFNTLVGINLKNKVEECAKTKIPRLYRFLEQEASHNQRLRQTLHSIKEAMEDPGCQGSEKVNLPGTPCVVTAGKPWEANRFQIAVGGQITTTVYNPIGALSVWFSSFYIFNLEYPPKASATVEFFQGCIAGINPPDGRGKSTKPKVKSIHPLVLKLSNKLKHLESEWSL
ncbi:hypothetical protein HOLleu_37789 [Holothuria leucospilota]|uniref:Uncharacterized protein n=1 Tax=Holothuria leucospilota TaxID=206669 RepID=A0A9Q0YK12_HOLLE|nr:hypothetical protein HOLleu_37789 [Holothuria leucospilota]